MPIRLLRHPCDLAVGRLTMRWTTRDADVLGLAIGPPVPAVGQETPEGHVLRVDERGRLVGLTLVGVQDVVHGSGAMTLPHRAEIASRDLAPALR